MEEEDEEIKIPKVKKGVKNTSAILIILMIVSLIYLGVYGFKLEEKYNECAEQFNKCTNNCVQFIKQVGVNPNNFDFELDTINVTNSTP